MVQEIFSNVRKHARATRVDFDVALFDDEVHLSVEDDGIGFMLSKDGPNFSQNGHGLHNIQERAKALGGEIVIDSKPNQGSRITICVPLRT